MKSPTNETITGPYSYDSAILETARLLTDVKRVQYSDKLMLIGLEGLSNAGKSSFSSRLERELTRDSQTCFSIEGDGFHQGREKLKPAYQELIADLEKGGEIPEDFIFKMWRYPEIQSQLIDWHNNFNNSSLSRATLVLNGLLKDKKDGSEHSETYEVSRDTTILVPAHYLRHLPGFDFFVYLEISPQTSAQRKIERDKKIGSQRDPETTRKMVEMIEYPIMLKQRASYPLEPGKEIIVDMNDFNRIFIR